MWRKSKVPHFIDPSSTSAPLQNRDTSRPSAWIVTWSTVAVQSTGSNSSGRVSSE